MIELDIKNPDVLGLAQALVRMETITANAHETPALEEISEVFHKTGFTCTLVHYDSDLPTRANLVAELNPQDTRPALCLGGHIDTVPFGAAEWDDEPLGAVVKDGKLYGRGSADMKGGISAMICAALKMAPRLNGRNITVHVYGGEEFGLLGSRYLALNSPEHTKNIGAVIVGEPTSNRPQFGHKGVTWFDLATTGVTSHAAMPEKGENALVKLLPGAARLAAFQPKDEHPHLGRSTLVPAVMQSGLNTNSVPDSAVLKLDCRTLPGQDMDALIAEIKALAGPEASLSIPADVPPLWTDPNNPWCLSVRKIVGEVTGKEAGPEVAVFATDAAALRLGMPYTPMVVLGPGDQGLAHMTNEYISIDELRQAQQIYELIIEDWYEI